jgi:hypothetical protein
VKNDGLWKARKTMVLFSAFPQALESQIDSNITTATTNTITEQNFHLKNRKNCPDNRYQRTDRQAGRREDQGGSGQKTCPVSRNLLDTIKSQQNQRYKQNYLTLPKNGYKMLEFAQNRFCMLLNIKDAIFEERYCARQTDDPGA